MAGNATYRPGDIAFTRGHDFWARGIQLFTKCAYNHVKMIISADGDVIEAVRPKVWRTKILPYDLVMEVPYVSDVDRQRAIDAVLAWENTAYSKVSIASDFFHYAGFPLLFEKEDEKNCSQLTAIGLLIGTNIPSRLLERTSISPADVLRLVTQAKVGKLS